MAERIQRMEKEIMYKPLPESVTIKQSGINGLGLFAQKGIAQAERQIERSLRNIVMTNRKQIKPPITNYIRTSTHYISTNAFFKVFRVNV